MPKGDTLGEFEQIVLLAILRLGENAYGMSIRGEIHERIGRDTAIGAVYATLDRLEGKSLVSSELGEATEERGGRAKKFFRLTAEGRRALERSLHDLGRMTRGLRLPAIEGGR